MASPDPAPEPEGPVSNPFRPGLPFLLGCSLPIAIVAFFAMFHAGKEPLDALQFAAATLLASLMATVVVMVVGASIAAIANRQWLRFLALRLVVPAMGAAWFFVGFKREWFGTFSLEVPSPDGAYGARVSLGDLTGGFLVIPLALAIYHRRWIHERYCRVDLRTLGVLRIVIGALLTADSIRHWKEARYFYANTGVLTNHYLLAKPFSPNNFTLWNAFSSLGEVHVIFALATLCYFFLLVGWRTRLFSILSFLLVTSQDNRLVLAENGGYVVVNCLVGWAMFMPLGQRFSVDALLRSYREHKEKTWGDLNRRFRPADKFALAESSIFLLATVNIALIYFFNVVNKSGNIWKSGLTVHYVLHLDRMVTGLAVFFRELHLPLALTRVVAWAVLALESLICAWILSPYGRRYTRPLAMVSMHALHGVFGTMFRLGPFSWFMIAWSYLLPNPENWADLEARFRRRARPLTVVLDRRSPLAFATGRLLARLDALDLLTFEPSPEDEASPPLVLARDADGRAFTGPAAFREICRALPAGRPARLALLVATLGALGPLLRALEARRAGVARFFGLSVGAKGAPELREPSPLGLRLAGHRVTARETLIAYLATCAFFQLVNENKCFPPQLKPKMPPYMTWTVGYPRMFQGWGMFAANPITDDGSVSVDAVTIDGRHVDPFTGEAPDLNLSDARGLGLNQIWQDYFNRIRLERNKTYRAGLKDYLLKWHLQTGRPEDELVAFDVFWLRDQCPRPGEDKPYGHEKIALLTYRKPGYRPPKGQPPLPPEPKVGNAESPSAERLKDPIANEPDPTDAPPPPEKRGSGDVGK